jgi:uncharacterized membrane protein
MMLKKFKRTFLHFISQRTIHTWSLPTIYGITALFAIVFVYYMLFLYVFEWTCSCKSLQNGPKLAGEDPSETT